MRKAKFSRGVMYAPDLKIPSNRSLFNMLTELQKEVQTPMHELISTYISAFSYYLLSCINLLLKSSQFSTFPYNSEYTF